MHEEGCSPAAVTRGRTVVVTVSLVVDRSILWGRESGVINPQMYYNLFLS